MKEQSMPRHSTRTTFVKGDPRLLGVKQSPEHVGRKALALRKRVIVECDNCEAELEVTPSRARNLKHHFCDRKCYQKWQKKTNWFNNRSYNLTEEGRRILKEVRAQNGREVWERKTNGDKETWIQEMRLAQETRPTKPEKILLKIIEEFGLLYRYVGDGQFWLGRINPDFVNVNSKKIIIEVFGDYWHNRKDSIKRDQEKGKLLKGYGWDRLIIWEHELNSSSHEEIKNKILQYEEVYHSVSK